MKKKYFEPTKAAFILSNKKIVMKWNIKICIKIVLYILKCNSFL